MRCEVDFIFNFHEQQTIYNLNTDGDKTLSTRSLWFLNLNNAMADISMAGVSRRRSTARRKLTKVKETYIRKFNDGDDKENDTRLEQE